MYTPPLHNWPIRSFYKSTLIIRSFHIRDKKVIYCTVHFLTIIDFLLKEALFIFFMQGQKQQSVEFKLFYFYLSKKNCCIFIYEIASKHKASICVLFLILYLIEGSGNVFTS